MCVCKCAVFEQHVLQDSTQDLAKTNSKSMDDGKIIITGGKPRFKILHCSTFKGVHTCRGDFLKHALHDKNLSVF